RLLLVVQGRLHRPDVGERRVHRDVDRLVVLGRQQERQLLDDLDRLEVVQVHLPVPADQRLAGRRAHRADSRSAANPGRSPSSSSSNDAPPPVDTWSTSASNPNCLMAAAESPPPTTVKAFVSARAWATDRVPAANRGSSNTPIGPFHSTVRASMITSV